MSPVGSRRKVGDADVVNTNRVITIACSLPATKSTSAGEGYGVERYPQRERTAMRQREKAIVDRVTELLNSLVKK